MFLVPLEAPCGHFNCLQTQICPYEVWQTSDQSKNQVMRTVSRAQRKVASRRRSEKGYSEGPQKHSGLYRSEIEEVWNINLGKRVFVRDVTKTPAVTVAEPQRSVVREKAERTFDRTITKSAFLYLALWSQFVLPYLYCKEQSYRWKPADTAYCQSGCFIMHIK